MSEKPGGGELIHTVVVCCVMRIFFFKLFTTAFALPHTETANIRHSDTHFTQT